MPKAALSNSQQIAADATRFLKRKSILSAGVKTEVRDKEDLAPMTAIQPKPSWIRRLFGSH